MNRAAEDAAIVTGLGCICAAGETVGATMAALFAGRRSCAPPTAFAADLPAPYPVFEITAPLEALLDSASDIFLQSIDVDKTARTARLALVAAGEALRQAGLNEPRQRHGLRIGVCLGTTVGCTLGDEAFYRELRRGGRPGLAPVERYLRSNPALCLAEALGLDGPAVTLANACASGTDAVGLAREWVREGRCDAVIAGGADELSRITYLGFIHLLIAAPEPCRPFDRRRQGLNLGEGAGIMIVERRATAARCGARALAEVVGYATCADAWHLTAPHPEGRGLRRALALALADAGAAPGEVAFVNAHGTSTPDNDRIEGRALADLFQAGVPVVSTKAYTGHTLGAAGGIEAVLTVQSLLERRVPATAGFAEPDPDCGLTPTIENVVLDHPVEGEPLTAVSDSLGFGGGNSALIFRTA